MAKEIFCFEVLCIDPTGEASIITEESMASALIYPKALWRKAKTEKISNRWNITDDELKLSLTIKSIDTGKILSGGVAAAFILSIESPNFDAVEEIRVNLLLHLKVLKFKHIKILADDISKDIANKLYPEVNKIENLLRRYLTKFFILNMGLGWWDVTAPQAIIDKVNSRKKDRKERSKDTFSDLTSADDLSFADFDDLGELIYKQSSGFNSKESVIQKINSVKSIEDLEHLKSALQDNYTKYFNNSFRDRKFDLLWKELFNIRNKVAHNGHFSKQELIKGIELSNIVANIIQEAETKIESFNISIEEQESIRQATIEAEEISKRIADSNFSEIGSNYKSLNDDDEPEFVGRPFKYITEDQLINELRIATEYQNKNKLPFIGLKRFVTKNLYDKGYIPNSTYGIINNLKAKGVIDIYETESADSNFKISGIRFV